MARSDVVPIWEKANLSMEEAAAYFGIGINKLREMTNEDNCPFVLWNGSKRMIKRKAFEKFLEAAYSIVGLSNILYSERFKEGGKFFFGGEPDQGAHR